MIVSASRRTDIPAFYSDWLFKRIREGFVLVRNPMNIHQVSRISLSPDIVDCFVFWSKNPEPMMNRLPLLQRFNYYFQFTITAYDRLLEPNVPSIDKAINCFQLFSHEVGSKRVIWRYDPIIFTRTMDQQYHIKHFELIASRLKRYTKRCVVSFLDSYKKSERNLKSINPLLLASDQIKPLLQTLKAVAQKYDMEMATCAEEMDFADIGVPHGKCIDDKLIAEISGRQLDVKKDKTQRAECGCVASIDIGAYNTCSHGCLYCYANYDSKTVKKNVDQHDPESPLLFGSIGPDDKITERKVYSCFEIQRNMF